jgi:hypothetical protein
LVPLDNIRLTTPALNQSSIKNKKLQRRQTIDTVQGREYASNQQHRTALQQLQDVFWPARETSRTTIINNQLDEHEEMPMVTEKRNTNVQRSSSARENNQATLNDNLNERRRRPRTHQHSETMAVV